MFTMKQFLKPFYYNFITKYFLLFALIILEYYWGQYISPSGLISRTISSTTSNIISYLSTFFLLIILLGFIIYPTPSLKTVSRFFDSTIKKNILTIFLLLFFLSNLTWLIDITHNLMFVYGNSENELVLTIICAFCMYYATIMFASNFETPQKPNVIISGLSIRPCKREITDEVTGETTTIKGEIYFSNFDLLFKMYSQSTYRDIENFVIIPSEILDISIIKINTGDILDNLCEESPEFKEAVDAFNRNTEDKKATLKRVFSIFLDKTKQLRPNIVILDPVDYNSEFNELISNIDKQLELLPRKELKNGNIDNAYVFVSPGTTLLASVFSFISLKGYRQIMYSSQNPTEKGKVNVYSSENITISKISGYLDEKSN